jgi:hypothetical protein
MGIVFRAEDTRLEWVVALKLLPSHAPNSEDTRAPFCREGGNLVCLAADTSLEDPFIEEPEILFSGQPFGHNFSTPSLFNSLFDAGPAGDRTALVGVESAGRTEARTVSENWFQDFETT